MQDRRSSIGDPIDRIPFSPIIDRPRFTLPDGARVALLTVPNIEFYDYIAPPNPVRTAWGRMPQPDVLGYGMRDYGNRVGLTRIFDVLDDFHIRATISLNVAVLQHHPGLLEEFEARSWDYACHGMYNTRYLWELSREEEREAIQECQETFREIVGRDFGGWFSPALSQTLNTADLVAEAGIAYFGDWVHDDQPTPMRAGDGWLLSMPYSVELNDAVSHRQGHESPVFAQAIIDAFDTLYSEGDDQARVLCLAIHPYELGQPHRIRDLSVALEHITAHPGVWLTTGQELADWYRATTWDRMVEHLEDLEQIEGYSI